MLRIFICCSIVFSSAVLFAQQRRNWDMGLSASYGLHANIIDQQTSSFQARGRSSFMVWWRVQPKTMELAFEPRLGFTSVNYRYRLTDKGKTLSNEWIYATLELNSSFKLHRNSNNRWITGIFLRRQLAIDMSVFVRDAGTTAGIHFDKELERLDLEGNANDWQAGMKVGYRFELPDLKRLSVETSVQQDVINFYSNTINFAYSINRQEKEVLLNGKATALIVNIRYLLF